MTLVASDENHGAAEAAASHAAPAEGELHAEVGHEAPHEGGGLPQMDVTTYSSQLFWLGLTFLFLYGLLSRMVLPRIGQVLEERRDRIASDLDKASVLQRESEEALQAYENELTEARAKAHSLGQETRDRLAEDADAKKATLEAKLSKKLSEAEVKIKETKDKALTSIREVANETSAAVITQLLGEDADQAAIVAAVDVQLQNRKD